MCGVLGGSSLLATSSVYAQTVEYAYAKPQYSSGSFEVGKTVTFQFNIYASDGRSGTTKNDRTASGVIQYTPGKLKFKNISAGSVGQPAPIATPTNYDKVYFYAKQISTQTSMVTAFFVDFEITASGSFSLQVAGDGATINDQPASGSNAYIRDVPAPPGQVTTPPPPAPPKQPTQPPSYYKGSSSSKSSTSNTNKSNSSSGSSTSSGGSGTNSSSKNDVSLPGTQDEPAIGDIPSSTPDPTGIIDGVSVTPSHTSAVISWDVNSTSPSSTLSYGDSSSNLDQTATVSKAESGKFTTTLSKLTPGKRYSYMISATGGTSESSTYSGTFLAIGFPITITVTENDVPIKTGMLKIGGSSYPIGGDKLTINVAAGKYTATVSTDTATTTQDIEVKSKSVPADGSDPEAQQFKFALTSSVIEGGPGSGNSILTFVGILVGGTALLAVAGFVFITIRRRRFESGGGYSSSGSQSSITIDDGYQWKGDSGSAPTTPTSTSSPYSENFNKSVYIDDGEVEDMFDKAKK